MSLPAFSPVERGDRAVAPRPETALVVLLGQLRGLLEELPPSVYQARPAPRVSGSVGGHVRHCLDHVAALIAGSTTGELSYDHRLRGTLVESDPAAAVLEIDRLIDGIGEIGTRPLEWTIRLRSLVDRSGLDVATESSIARELAYVVHHTTHHFAIIALLLDRLGCEPPAGFGLAPSTPRLH